MKHGNVEFHANNTSSNHWMSVGQFAKAWASISADNSECQKTVLQETWRDRNYVQLHGATWLCSRNKFCVAVWHFYEFAQAIAHHEKLKCLSTNEALANASNRTVKFNQSDCLQTKLSLSGKLSALVKDKQHNDDMFLRFITCEAFSCCVLYWDPAFPGMT